MLMTERGVVAQIEIESVPHGGCACSADMLDGKLTWRDHGYIDHVCH